MTLGGRRVKVKRPRVRSADDEHEVTVATYEYLAGRDPLTRVVMDRMLAGVSTRMFNATGEPVGLRVSGCFDGQVKMSVSEAFIEQTATALGELMARDFGDMRLAAMRIDGLEIAERTHVVALGITTDGVKIPLGLGEGQPKTPWPEPFWLTSLPGPENVVEVIPVRKQARSDGWGPQAVSRLGDAP